MIVRFDFVANGINYEIRAQRVPGPDFDADGGASFGLFKMDPGTKLYDFLIVGECSR